MVAANAFAELLERRMREMRVGVVEFAQSLGLAQSQLSRYLNGRSIPTLKTLRKLSTALQVDLAELESLIPTSEPTREATPDNTVALADAIVARLVALGGVEAIDPRAVALLRSPASLGTSSPHTDGDEAIVPPRALTDGHRYVAVTVRGDCLEPSGIGDGHTAIVDLDARRVPGDIVLARQGDGLLVKRLTRGYGQTLWLEADQDWDPLLVADGVEVLGVCIGFWFRPPR